MNKRFQLLTTLCFSLVILSNCKKDKNNLSDTLTSKTWKRGLVDKNPSSNPSGTVLYYAVINCEKDDTWKFAANGKLTLNRNADKCSASELQIEDIDYSLNKATKELTINGTKFTLIEETESQIKYYATVPTSSGFQNLVYLLQ